MSRCHVVVLGVVCLPIGSLIGQSTWASFTTSAPAPMRSDARMAGSWGWMFLFGGHHNGIASADLHAWTGNGWILRAAGGGIPARSGHAMAADLLRGRLVVFGGRASPAAVLGDTWELTPGDPGTWATISGAAPSARESAACAFEPQGQRVVLFGGRDAGGAVLHDTWSYDASGWQAVATAVDPGARERAAMIADPAGDRLVLFGGRDASGMVRDETWTFSASGWQLLVPPASPAPRFDAVFARDYTRHVGVLFGGRTVGGLVLGDTWEWGDSAWRLVATGTGLQPDAGAAASSYLAYGGNGNGVLLQRSDTGSLWSYGATSAVRGRLYGAACGGAGLLLAPPGRGPRLGATFEVLTQGAAGAHFLALGGPVAHVPLDSLGATGCWRHADILAVGDPVLPTNGTAVHRVPVPSDPLFLGLAVYLQGALFSPGTNPLGAVTTQGVALQVAGNDAPTTWYGNPHGFSTLVNSGLTNRPLTQIEAYGNRVQVPRSGRIVAVRKGFLWKTGYGEGDGGALLVEVQPDDGTAAHFPGGQVLGRSRSFWPKWAPSNKETNFYSRIELEAPVSVIAGQWIHIVLRNLDPLQATNWVSAEDLGTAYAIGGTSNFCLGPDPNRWPRASLLDLTVTHRSGGVWRDAAGRRTAILEVIYEDGGSFGNGYTNTGSVQGVGGGEDGLRSVDGNGAVRQVFRVSGASRVVTALDLRVLRRSGTGGLTATLTSAGVVLFAATAPASATRLGGHQLPYCGEATNAEWITLSIPATTLDSNVSYELALTTTVGTDYRVPATYDGRVAGYGFGPDTVFADGYAQYWSGASGWQNWSSTSSSSGLAPDQDLQFLFIGQ